MNGFKFAIWGWNRFVLVVLDGSANDARPREVILGYDASGKVIDGLGLCRYLVFSFVLPTKSSLSMFADVYVSQFSA